MKTDSIIRHTAMKKSMNLQHEFQNGEEIDFLMKFLLHCPEKKEGRGYKMSIVPKFPQFLGIQGGLFHFLLTFP
jgi:hypothetical protein